MNGYKIVFKDKRGAVDKTFFGEPVTNMDISKENIKDMIVGAFKNAHPKCKIISMTPSDSASWRYTD